ncbi:MAG: hypothetical protein L0I62_00005, partial [Gammaproteobacteria bacterium]|nr:hypothetical protein [Gammaproteobacteria bacterium]
MTITLFARDGGALFHRQALTVSFALFCGLVAALGIASSASASEVGAIQGHFSTTATGQAVYSIPLPAPGGAGGFAPRLSIIYASGSGPGLLGRDATIGGLSIIKRCPATNEDGSTVPVNFTSSDRFCLDGRTLKHSSGTYGHNGASYTITPTAHLKAYSYTSNNAAGPERFKVFHPDGSLWEYGRYNHSEVTAQNGSGETVGRIWALDRIFDASGNTITFHYTQPSGTNAYYLSKVEWGGNPGENKSADHEFVFSYATVPADAIQYHYVAGTLVTRDRRLSSVTLKYNNSLLLSWTPSYLPSGEDSNRTRLDSLEECDANGNCLPDTDFQWQEGAPGFEAAQNTGQSGPNGGAVFVADVNGDGREDLIYARSGDWWARFGAANGGLGSPRGMGASSTNHPTWAQPIHFRRGAADDILYVDSQGNWEVLHWNGSSFSSSNDNIPATGEAAAVDVDGDGYDDLVTYGAHKIYLRLNQASLEDDPGFGAVQTAHAYSSDADHYEEVLEFKAEGQTAARSVHGRLKLHHRQTGIIVKIHHHEVICGLDHCPPGSPRSVLDRTFDQVLTWNGNALEIYSQLGDGNFIALDVNGDGLSDLFRLDNAELDLNTGAGFEAVTYGSSANGLVLNQAVAVDYNGDGRDDILVPGTGGDWMLLASTGTALAASVDTGVSSVHFGAHPVVADLQGRGLHDLVGTSANDIYIASRKGLYPDLLTRVEDGLGNHAELVWTALSDADVVDPGGFVPESFEVTLDGKPVLEKVTRNDGIGGEYHVSWQYQTPLALPGSGFAGIETSVATDNRSTHTITREFVFNRYKSGFPKRVTIAQSNGDKIRRTERTYFDIDGGAPVNLDLRETTFYDKNGNRLYSLSKRFYYDDFHEPNKIKTQISDTSGDTWTTTVERATTQGTGADNWCYGLATSITTTKTLPTGESKTSKTNLTPDLGHCRYDQSVSNANFATQLQTTTNFTYGDLGNLRNIEVIGHKSDGSPMDSRVTQFGYDSHGAFRTSVTDPLGEETSIHWNKALGVKTSVTAPNGATTTIQHDGFGRIRQAALPSGAYTEIRYFACTQSCSRWAYFARFRTYDAGGGLVGNRRRYVDRYGRTYAKTVIRGGKWVQSLTRYNALGEVAQQSAPHFSGDSPHWTTYDYDALGRLKEITVPTGAEGTAITTVDYPDDFVTMVTDPADHATQKTVNPLGQVVSILDANGNPTTYQYGPFGQVVQVTGPDGTQSAVSYNGAGFRTSLNVPDLGGTLSFETDSLGEVTRKTDAGGNHTDYTYDKLGRMIA